MSLIDEARHAHRSGWDFPWLDERTESTPPRDYRERAQALVRQAVRILDMDTGGGEFLAGYAEPLRRLGDRISADGSFTVHDHRFLIEARRT
jgi:hypothetical protein